MRSDLALVAITLPFLFVSTQGASVAGNTTCKNPSVTWYNNADGQNPCEMYGRLRAICDESYSVPSMNSSLPPDICSNEACCCNSVAFGVAMMCLQCQQGAGTGGSGDSGIDAPPQTMQRYFSSCSTTQNGKLPEQVQAGVCRTGLDLMAYQYDVLWTDGSWFLEYIRGVAMTQAASGKLDPKLCIDASTTAPPAVSSLTPSSSSPQLSSTSTSTDDNTPSNNGHVSPALICGIVAGVLGVFVLLPAVAWVLVNVRRRKAASVDGSAPWSDGTTYAYFQSNTTSSNNTYPGVKLHEKAMSIFKGVSPGIRNHSHRLDTSSQSPSFEQVVGAGGRLFFDATSAFRDARGVRLAVPLVSIPGEFVPGPPRYEEVIGRSATT